MPEPAAEVTLTVDDVDRLLSAQHPRLRGSLHRVAHGWDNDVFRLGERWAVRLPRRAAAAQLIEHEQRWLPTLAARLPVPVPAPIAVGMPQGDYPWRWSVVPWFDGSRMIDLPPVERDRFVERIADVLESLHVPAPPDAPHNPFRGVAMRTRDDIVRARLSRWPHLRTAWDAAVSAPEWSAPAVWVHGDLHPANLVTDGGELAAVIDFGDMCGGDPACDLAVAWMAFTADGRDRLCSRLSGRYDDATWLRAKGWAAAFAATMHDVTDSGMRAMSAHTTREIASDST